MRHKYIWGLCAGEVEIPVQIEKFSAPRSGVVLQFQVEIGIKPYNRPSAEKTSQPRFAREKAPRLAPLAAEAGKTQRSPWKGKFTEKIFLPRKGGASTADG